MLLRLLLVKPFHYRRSDFVELRTLWQLLTVIKYYLDSIGG